MATIPYFIQSQMHSLQYLAAMRVTMSVCESNEVQNRIRRFRIKMGNTTEAGFIPKWWKRLHKKVIKNLEAMKLPKLIMNMILENLWPIAFEIFRWIVYHIEDTGIEYSSRYCWDSEFKIDYKKTAQNLVADESLNMKMRFKLACIYCFDSEVRSLWENMSLSERRTFLNQNNLREFFQNPIAIYWLYYLQDNPIHSWRHEVLDHSQLFNFAVENGYLYATEFFLEELGTNETILSVVNSNLRVLINAHLILRDHIYIVSYLFHELAPDLQDDYIELKWVVLFCLRWQMQKRFLTVFNNLKPCFERSHYIYIFERIFQNIMGNFKDHDYKALFMDVWHSSTEEIKTIIRREPELGYQFFMKFVRKLFRFVFKERFFGLKNKLRAILRQEEISGTETYFVKEDVLFLKFLIQERITTSEFINHFANRPFFNLPILSSDYQFSYLPVDELTSLIDEILEIV